MATKKFCKKYKLSWDQVWENNWKAYIVSSVANTIKSGVIYQGAGTDIRDIMWQLFLFYYGRNRDMYKVDLLYVMPSNALKDLITSLYGDGIEGGDKKLEAFLGIEIKSAPFLSQSVLLVSKKWSNVEMKCEFQDNHLNVVINPVFETRWVKAVLRRGKK